MHTRLFSLALFPLLLSSFATGSAEPVTEASPPSGIRWASVERLAAGPVDWAAGGERSFAIGKEGAVYFLPRVGHGAPVPQASLHGASARAFFLGDRLFLLEPGEGLRYSECDGAGAGRATLLPLPQLSHPVTRAGSHLFYCEESSVFRVEVAPSHVCLLDETGHCCSEHDGEPPPPFPEPVFVGDMGQRVLALAFFGGGKFFVAPSEGGLALWDPRGNRPYSTLWALPRNRYPALALLGDRFLVAGSPEGLSVYRIPDLLAPRPFGGFAAPVASLPIPCSDLFVEGREIFFSGAEGLYRAFLDSPEAVTVTVNVGNFFFSPTTVSVQQGDTVLWSRSAGGHTTTSGSSCVGNGLWDADLNVTTPSFSRVFSDAPGSYLYFCSIHCTMVASVGLTAATRAFPVPGSITPTRATTVDQGGTLALTWDATNCASTDYHVLFGFGSRLASAMTAPVAGDISGSKCDLGVSGGATWTNVPNPSGDATRFLWFLVVGDNGGAVEGSWGVTSAGAQRGGTLASGQCGCTTKNSTGTCAFP